MYFPSEKEFLKLTQKGNLIPVCREILGDLETPVSAYYKIAHKARYSFLLESVEGEEKIARFSFLAKDPELIFQTKDRLAQCTRFSAKDGKTGKPAHEIRKIKDTPLSFIREILSRYRFVSIPQLPRFCGGLVGYFSYDVVRFFEKLPPQKRNDLKLPDIVLVLAKDLIIFDHVNHKIKVVCCVDVQQKSSRRLKLREYRRALKRIDRLVDALKRPLVLTTDPYPVKDAKLNGLNVRSNFSEPQFRHIVEKAKQQIRSGEIIQVVLSQRFKVDLKANPFNIYRTLRVLNPSPYMYYLNFDRLKIIGSSPELLVRCEDGLVETRPIAGTRPRGRNDSEDERIAKDLLSDPKERAEHIMLVDLGRNDLGRVCQKGTVGVSEFMQIEKYSHVMHIVSNVRGQLKPGKDNLDVLQAAFPAGTVSGAPKIRAMEIIEELENIGRGPYAGCIGYFSFSGNLDTCITIRTIIISGKKAYVQAGAGIVADSRPKKEFQETVNKAKAQLTAIHLAHRHQ